MVLAELFVIYPSIDARQSVSVIPTPTPSQYAPKSKAFALCISTKEIRKVIDENKKNEFKSMLDKALSKDSELSFHVNPKLLGGIRLRVGNELIDASLINHLNKLRHEMLGAK